jgi:Myo-inositol-1-phosphate synthase
VLVVGLGGANGVTLLAGHIANTRKLSWEGPSPWGRMSANLLGCITQLPAKGGKGGYKERYALADFCDAAIGGWDIRPTPLGEALYNARILDFDLVRQVQVHRSCWIALATHHTVLAESWHCAMGRATTSVKILAVSEAAH